jgi:hypothetical protein
VLHDGAEEFKVVGGRWHLNVSLIEAVIAILVDRRWSSIRGVGVVPWENPKQKQQLTKHDDETPKQKPNMMTKPQNKNKHTKHGQITQPVVSVVTQSAADFP